MNTVIKTPAEVTQLPVAGLRKLASQLKIKNPSIHNKVELTKLVLSAVGLQESPDEVAEETPAEETIETPIEETVEEAETPEGESTTVEPIVEESKVEKVKVSRKSPRLEVTPEMKAIIDSVEIVKSEKFRKLATLGMSIPQIAEVMKSHYSFVHGVVERGKNLIS